MAFTGPTPEGQPAIALLDGLPLQKHAALNGRLTVDDPDGYERDYPANTRSHGTSMASLIIWGDLNTSERVPIPQPLYVRPIMRPNHAQTAEHVPEGILIVDLVHRAVRRLFDGEGQETAVAPTVAVINFSIGIVSDGWTPFFPAGSERFKIGAWQIEHCGSDGCRNGGPVESP